MPSLNRDFERLPRLLLNALSDRKKLPDGKDQLLLAHDFLAEHHHDPLPIRVNRLHSVPESVGHLLALFHVMGLMSSP